MSFPGSPDFSRTLLGYAPKEVREFVAQAEECIRGLGDPSGNGSGGHPGNDEAIASGRQTAEEILESAEAGADRIRRRAEKERVSRLEKADQEAHDVVSLARQQAYEARESAWREGTEMLKAVEDEGTALRNEAKEAALKIIDSAERKAFRMLTAARRDSESLLLRAHVEFDRATDLAEASGALIDGASEGVGMQGLPNGASTGVSDSDRENDEPEHSSTVKIIPAGVEQEPDMAARSDGSSRRRSSPQTSSTQVLDWADGTENVRLISVTGASSILDVDAVEMADEVARIRSAGAKNGGQKGSRVHPRPGSGGGPAPSTKTPTRRSPSSRPGDADPADHRAADDLSPLFAKLRSEARRGR